MDLHAQLQSLRYKADQLEVTMQSHYNLPSLILKSIPKRGAVVYVKTSKANLLDTNKDVAFIGGSGSTRHYILAVSSELLMVVMCMLKLKTFFFFSLQVLVQITR